MNSESVIRDFLRSVDVEFGAARPWDFRVRDARLFDRLLSGGTLAVGESYMDGWWDSGDLAELVARVFRGGNILRFLGKGILWRIAVAKITNLQTVRRASHIADAHYDIGDDLYAGMLGEDRIYSCGYWGGLPSAKTLAEAQEAKLDLVCRKIGLTNGQTVLDIGCGWGGVRALRGREIWGKSGRRYGFERPGDNRTRTNTRPTR